MDILLIALAILNLLSILYFWYRIIKMKQKIFGTILINDNNSMYVELDSPDTIYEIFNSKYATFKVHHFDSRN